MEENEVRQFTIDKHVINPGEHKIIKIGVGRLPSDTKIYIQAHIIRALDPGPTVLILGGIHGDEINGIEIVRRSLHRNIFTKIKCGSVIVIPLLNVYGFINFSREVPDGKDVNRSFPGSTAGSLASRVARTLTKKILPVVDYAIDFHTGGASRYNYPQVRYSKLDPKAEELSKIFAPRFIIKSSLLDKSFRKAAKKVGIPAIVFEGGESIRLDGPSIETGIDGIQRVLHHLKVLDGPKLNPKEKTVMINKTSWIRAPYSGMFEWTQSSGKKVQKGDALGFISDPFATKTVLVSSPKAGYIIGHNNASVVNQGDALFHIGYEYEEL